MGETSTLIVFYILSAIIIGASILAVTARRMLRAATYLLFVLIGTAGLYLLLNYHFLAAVQLAVYAGGIVVLFIFAILLTSAKGDKLDPHDIRRMVGGGAMSLVGLGVVMFTVFKHKFMYSANTTIVGDQEINMTKIGEALMGTGKYQYLFSFEALSILLLACIIGGVLIARKR